MLIFILNFLIYLTAYLYLLTVAINFFYPISYIISIIVLIAAFTISFINARRIPLINPLPAGRKIDTIIIGAFSTIVAISWFLIAVNRLSLDTDLNVYYMPTSILMNASIWYQGIGMLSSVMSFSNGTSILASLFTSFNHPGLEFIPGLWLWALYGIGIFVYLRKRSINQYISLITASLFLLTPRFFWESYNMGTDMPMACFLTLGLIALSNREFENAALFLALSAVFKPLGQAAYILFMVGFLSFMILKRDIKKLFSFKIIFSLILLLICSLRLYIATGNPFYPAIALKLSSWGIPIQDQLNIISNGKAFHQNSLAQYKESYLGVLYFLRDFFIFPRRLNSSNWFSLFFLSCLFSGAYLFIREKRYRDISLHSWLVLGFISILIISWFLNVPQFRFIIGVWIFMTLILFCFSIENKPPIILKGLIYLSLIFTLVFFSANVVKHLRFYVIPMLGLSFEDAQARMPYKPYEDMFSEVIMDDGFSYTVSGVSYCGRSKPPCIHRYTIGNEDDVIKAYKKYNNNFLSNRKKG